MKQKTLSRECLKLNNDFIKLSYLLIEWEQKYCYGFKECEGKYILFSFKDNLTLLEELNKDLHSIGMKIEIESEMKTLRLKNGYEKKYIRDLIYDMFYSSYIVYDKISKIIENVKIILFRYKDYKKIEKILKKLDKEIIRILYNSIPDLDFYIRYYKNVPIKIIRNIGTIEELQKTNIKLKEDYLQVLNLNRIY